jgi:TolC family type I secretion outer membrane protein
MSIAAYGLSLRGGRRPSLLVLLLALAGTSVGAVTLGELLPIARDYDSQYRAARAQFQAAAARLDLARSAFFPTVSASGNSNYNNQSIGFPNLPVPTRGDTFNTNGINLQLTQPLYRRLNTAGLKQSQAQLDQAQAQLEQAEGELANRLALAFFEAIQAREARGAAAVATSMALQQRTAYGSEFAAGTKALGEKMDASAKWELASAQEFDAASELGNKLFALRMITGLALTPAELNPSGTLVPKQLQTFEYWVEQAEEKSPALRAQRAARDAARYEIDKASSGRYPTLDLVASYGRSKQGPSPSQSNEALVRAGVIGLQLNVPIYSGGAIDAKEREAASLLQKAEEDLDTARRQIQLAVQQAYSGVMSNTLQAKAFEQAVSAGEQLVKAAQQAERLGTKTPLEVLMLQQQLASSRRDLAKAQTNILLSVVRLHSAVGDLAGRAGSD